LEKKEKRKMDAKKAFENVKDQIGFCGIWCGSCVVGNGTLQEITKRYKKLIQAYGVSEWCPKDFDYDEFTKGLASLQRMPLCSGCMKGGGRDNCEIRACASDKELQDCTECSEHTECKHDKILEQMRSGALKAGLFVRANETDRETLLLEWIATLKTKWPSCILFMKDETE
jgi:hypothetical protein